MMPKKNSEGQYQRWLLTNRVDEEDLQRGGLAIRDAYIAQRKRIYPEYCMEGSLFNDTRTWCLLMMRLWELQPDPADFVRAVLAAYNGTIPPPAVITGDSAVVHYKAWKSKATMSDPEAQEMMGISAEAFRMRLEQYPDRSERDILINPTCQCDPLFKWCRLRQLDCPDDAQQFEAAARVMLTEKPIRKAYAFLFPELADGGGK